MNTLTGLKKLLGKLGGDPTKVDNNGDAIDAIAEAYADHVGAVIDDEHSSTDTTYSSDKIESVAGDKLPELASTDTGVFLFGSKTTGESSPTWKKTPPIIMGYVYISTGETPSISSVELKDGVTRGNLGRPEVYPEAHITMVFDGGFASCDACRIGIDGGEPVAIFEGYLSSRESSTWTRKKYTVGLSLRDSGASAIDYIKVEDFTW